MPTNHYAALDVAPTADQATIESAWRRAAVHWHADRWSKAAAADQQLAAERYRAARAAHDVLSDPKQRAAFDAELTRAPAGMLQRILNGEPTERERRGMLWLRATVRLARGGRG